MSIKDELEGLREVVKSAVREAVCEKDIEGLQGPSAEQIVRMQKEDRKVVLLGRVKNGKVEIDQDRLDELERKYPGANMAFVAVNAPFDPVSNSTK